MGVWSMQGPEGAAGSGAKGCCYYGREGAAWQLVAPKGAMGCQSCWLGAWPWLKQEGSLGLRMQGGAGRCGTT